MVNASSCTFELWMHLADLLGGFLLTRTRGIVYCSLRTADAFPVVASLPPKNSVCELASHAEALRGSSRVPALRTSAPRRELPTITRFPATLNADFFMKQLPLKLCM